MKFSFVIKAAFLITLFHTAFPLYASDMTNFKFDQEILYATFTSWAEEKNIDKKDISRIQTSLVESPNINRCITHLINGMVECGASSPEIDALVTGNGFTIPASAKLDRGLHGMILGGSSVLGSAGANLRTCFNGFALA